MNKSEHFKYNPNIIGVSLFELNYWEKLFFFLFNEMHLDLWRLLKKNKCFMTLLFFHRIQKKKDSLL